MLNLKVYYTVISLYLQVQGFGSDCVLYMQNEAGFFLETNHSISATIVLFVFFVTQETAEHKRF